MSGISRRHFGRTVAAALTSRAGAAIAPLTAGQAIERIVQKLAAEGVERRAKTTDTIKVGDAATPVTGIATTFQATFAMLKKAAAAKTNLVLSHESLFWGDGVNRAPGLTDDPVYRAKRQFAEKNGIVVWRFHDGWHGRKPDPIFAALTRQLGWDRYFRPAPDGDTAGRSAYELPETTLAAVARHVRERLGTRNVRVVGNPRMAVRRVANSVHWLTACVPALRTADAVLVGETGELDTMEYVRDSNTLGMPKGLLVISHNMLEEWGMRPAVDWVAQLFPELPVKFIGSGEPYSLPEIQGG